MGRKMKFKVGFKRNGLLEHKEVYDMGLILPVEEADG
jgi:hypothetical protein